MSDNIYGGGNSPTDQVEPIGTSNISEGGEAYSIAIGGSSIMLDIRLSSGEGKFITYNLIQEIDYLSNEFLSIVTPSCIIEIQGTQLKQLAKRLARHEAEWIAEGKGSADGLKIDEIKIHTSGETIKTDKTVKK